MKKTFTKLWNGIVGLLKSGTSPEKLALTCALGVVIGTLPVWGITTALCFVMAPLFRVNMVILQLVNYLLYPAQLLLILPFIKMGTYLFDLNPLPYTLDQLVGRFESHFMTTLEEVGVALGLGVGVWVIASLIVFPGVYLGTLSLFRRWKSHFSEN
ncbi:MAG TPA: DUF2062 domain-containing protein [Cyclobacteriaceae bacterium]|nr:DUF2062 domain-containing protein [Cyclobacteriaceae bacterium]